MAGGILILLSTLTTKIPWLNSLTDRKKVTALLLSTLILILPLFVMELVLRPFAQLDQKTTSMYLKDPDLGWRLRPNTTHVWDHKSAKINSKGIRGPELDYDKPAGVTRVLFLGDSVTFGEGLKTFEEAFPFLIGQKLTAQLKKPVEAINTGVGGYSPWQEAIYLEKEGIKYHPDLVVVTFVLNDVTENLAWRVLEGLEKAGSSRTATLPSPNGWPTTAASPTLRDGLALAFASDQTSSKGHSTKRR